MGCVGQVRTTQVSFISTVHPNATSAGCQQHRQLWGPEGALHIMRLKYVKIKNKIVAWNIFWLLISVNIYLHHILKGHIPVRNLSTVDPKRHREVANRLLTVSPPSLLPQSFSLAVNDFTYMSRTLPAHLTSTPGPVDSPYSAPLATSPGFWCRPKGWCQGRILDRPWRQAWKSRVLEIGMWKWGGVTGGKWTFYLSWSNGLLPQWERVRWDSDAAL